MLITEGFHHTTMVSSGAARTRAFYEALLGLALREERPGHLLFGSGPGSLLSFYVRPQAERGRWGLGGVHHLALGVADEAAQLKWKRRLTDAGVPVSGPYNRGWFHSIYFADPDGQILEIATAGPGYQLDEPIDQLGQRVVMPKPEQMRGGRDEAAIRARTHAQPVPDIGAGMQLQGIHHITGFTNDIVRADEFLHQALGLRLVKRSVNQDDPKTPHWFWASYDLATVKPHSSFTLFEWKNSNYVARMGAGQTDHVAFRAASIEQLHEWEEHLKTMGVEVTRSTPHTGTGIAFRAPDGQRFELAC